MKHYYDRRIHLNTGIPQPRGLPATRGPSSYKTAEIALRSPVFMEFRDVRAVLRVGFQQSTVNKFSCITKGTFLTNEMGYGHVQRIISFITKLKGDCCDDSNESLGFITTGNNLRR